jgi:outer membrane lipoprotein-sorting protein
MTNFRKAVFAGLMALGFSAAVLPALAADDLPKVLARLDASAASFKSAQADITWDNTQTQPIEDTDRQIGTILFQRKGADVAVALHIKTDNGQVVNKDLVYANGTGKLYEPRLKQMQVFKLGDKKSQLDSLLTLGFGGSGKDLEKSWTITSQGTEAVGGVTAEKLLLVPKDAELLKSVPKLLLWIDMDKGLAVKQQRFDASGNYVVFSYANVKQNVSVPGGAFEIKTAAGTQVVNH